MNITRRQLLILLPAAAVAWEHVLAGTPENAPNYKSSEHWWGMLVDITKCIGCGSCVRACQMENHVPDGYFRTWVERYVVQDWGFEHVHVDSPDGGKNGFPDLGGDAKSFFVPKLCNHCADSPCTQVCPVGATFVSPDGVGHVAELLFPEIEVEG
jgi:Fe-S-cluster-containing dehydrogenase component